MFSPPHTHHVSASAILPAEPQYWMQNLSGNSECEVVSCVDIKDAYHSIRLTEKSKEYCGILPYFGSPIYRYEVVHHRYGWIILH